MLKYSIIIPTLNEEYFITKNLELLSKFNDDVEIIISDGGSADSTFELCKNKNVKFVRSSQGRGIQLNNGAKEANGEILIFLHADTFLPENAFDLIDATFAVKENKIARFKLGFDFKNNLLDYYKSFSRFNSRFTQFGDSAIMVRTDFFNSLNGFSDRETFEDVDFFIRASEQANIVLMEASVSSSARRFISDGVIKRQLLNIFLFIGYILHVNKKILGRFYKYPMKKKTNSLILFLRYPTAGEVKTRLAKTTSPEFAVKFYKDCAEKIIQITKRMRRINRFAFFSNKHEASLVSKWLGSKFFFAPQEGDDLGLRMHNAFEKVFSTGAEKIVIVGTDIPDLSKEIIEDAFSSLDDNDIVIGPSNDGGYYLLGMKKMYPQLFNGIEFSVNDVLTNTIHRVEELNLRFHLLPELQDIDTETDLLNWFQLDGTSKLKNEIELIYNTKKERIHTECVHCSQF